MPARHLAGNPPAAVHYMAQPDSQCQAQHKREEVVKLFSRGGHDWSSPAWRRRGRRRQWALMDWRFVRHPGLFKELFQGLVCCLARSMGAQSE